MALWLYCPQVNSGRTVTTIPARDDGNRNSFNINKVTPSPTGLQVTAYPPLINNDRRDTGEVSVCFFHPKKAMGTLRSMNCIFPVVSLGWG